MPHNNIIESYTFDTKTSKNNQGHFLTKEEWVSILNNPSLLTEEDKNLLHFWYSLPNSSSITSRWAPETPFVAIHNMFAKLADKVFASFEYHNVMYTSNSLGGPSHPRKISMFLTIYIEAGSEEVNGKSVKGFIFTLRDELKEAMQEIGYSLWNQKDEDVFIKNKRKSDEKQFKKIAKQEEKEDNTDE